MSSPILPAQGPPGPPSTTPQSSAAVDAAGVFVAGLAAGVDAASVRAARGGPPPEVLDEIVAVGALAQQLCESGYQLRFFPAQPSERTRIELHDADGSTVGVLTATQAVELAAARPTE